jgi:hypothetical protein
VTSSRLIASVVAICVAAAVCACGGASHEGADAVSAEKTSVLNAIDSFYLAFTQAEGREACALLTPRLRREFMKVAVGAVPSLKVKPCGRVFLGFYERVAPENAPRAITLAAGPESPAVKLDGTKATASYKSGGVIRLEKSHGKWLIAEAELLPTPSPDQVQ